MSLTRDLSHFKVIDGPAHFCIPLASSWFDRHLDDDFYPLQSFFTASETLQLGHANRILLNNLSESQSSLYFRYIVRCWHQTVAKCLPILYGYKKLSDIYSGRVQSFQEADGPNRYVNPFRDGGLSNPLFSLLAEMPGFTSDINQELDRPCDLRNISSFGLIDMVLARPERTNIHSRRIVAVLGSSVVDIDQYIRAIVSEGFHVELYILESLGYWGDWEWAKSVCLSVHVIRDILISDVIFWSCPRHLRELGEGCVQADTVKEYLRYFEASRSAFVSEVDYSYELIRESLGSASKASYLCIPDRPTVGYGLFLKFFLAKCGADAIITMPHVGFSYSPAWLRHSRVGEQSLSPITPLSVSLSLRSISCGLPQSFGTSYSEMPGSISLEPQSEALVIDAGCYLSRNEIICDYGYLLKTSVELRDSYGIGTRRLLIRFKNVTNHSDLVAYYEVKCLDRGLVNSFIVAKKNIEVSSRTSSSVSVDNLINSFCISIFSGPTTAMLPVISAGSDIYVMGDTDRSLLSRSFALPKSRSSSMIDPLRQFSPI